MSSSLCEEVAETAAPSQTAVAAPAELSSAFEKGGVGSEEEDVTALDVGAVVESVTPSAAAGEAIGRRSETAARSMLAAALRDESNATASQSNGAATGSSGTRVAFADAFLGPLAEIATPAVLLSTPPKSLQSQASNSSQSTESRLLYETSPSRGDVVDTSVADSSGNEYNTVLILNIQVIHLYYTYIICTLPICTVLYHCYRLIISYMYMYRLIGCGTCCWRCECAHRHDERLFGRVGRSVSRRD